MSDIELDPQYVASGADYRDVADTGTLARYWNDTLPDAVNVDTIGWWLHQAAKAEAGNRDSAAPSGSVSVPAFPKQIP